MGYSKIAPITRVIDTTNKRNPIVNKELDRLKAGATNSKQVLTAKKEQSYNNSNSQTPEKAIWKLRKENGKENKLAEITLSKEIGTVIEFDMNIISVLVK